VSPFVIKLEARLRFSKLPYKTDCGSVFKAPKSKIPYVQIDETEASQMGDSTMIVRHLVEQGDLEDLMDF